MQSSEGQKTLADLLANGEQRIQTAWKEADAFRHRPTKGDARELPVQAFLERQLPDRFGFASGEAIDVEGNRTSQLDLIAYDRIRVGPFFAAEHDALFPAEAILATIEVKSVLSKGAMEQFAGSVAQIHALKPHGKPFSYPRSGGAHDDGQPRVQSTLFAYESDLGETDWAVKELGRSRECAAKKKCPIRGLDRVVVLDRGLILPADGEAILKSDEMGVLRVWFFHLVNFLTREAERRRTFPWSDYADPTDEDTRSKIGKPMAPGRADSGSDTTRRPKQKARKKRGKVGPPQKRHRKGKRRPQQGKANT